MHTDADDYVFPTAAGRRDSESNVRPRFMAGAVERANEALEADGADPMPKLTPHSLRRTSSPRCCSRDRPSGASWLKSATRRRR
jgi:integrase